MIPVYVNEIKYALKNKCYFSALALTLTLPDLCGMAEFPKDDVGKRYISWIDNHLKDKFSHKKGTIVENNPSLTGEVIYNLRNTFLHQGSPNVQSEKIKDENNQFDKFVLVLGDGSVISNATIRIESPKDKDLEFKAIVIDVTFLCESICDCALKYYKKNEDKFIFKFNAITQEEYLKGSEREHIDLNDPQWLVDLINQKLKSIGSTKRVETTDCPVETRIERY